MKRLIAGKVIEVRYDPQELMGAIDLAKAIGVYSRGMSLGQVVRAAVRFALEVGLKNGLIQRRDGFEFNEMMAQHESAHSTKLRMAKQIDQVLSGQRENPDMGGRLPDVIVPAFEKVRMQRRLDELVAKREADPINFSAEEQAECERLADILIVGS